MKIINHQYTTVVAGSWKGVGRTVEKGVEKGGRQKKLTERTERMRREGRTLPVRWCSDMVQQFMDFCRGQLSSPERQRTELPSDTDDTVHYKAQRSPATESDRAEEGE